MIIITNEEKLKLIYDRYKPSKISAFSMAKKKSIQVSDDVKIAYDPLNFLPDNDTINAVVNKDRKGGKVIRTAIRNLMNPNEKSRGLNVAVTQFVAILRSAQRNEAEDVFVFVEDGDDARNKFLRRYVCEIMGLFGFDVCTDNKLIKKIFANKKKAKVNIKNMKAFVKKHPNYIGIGSDGHAIDEFFKLNNIYYSVEMHMTAISTNLARNLRLDSRKFTKQLEASLVGSYTNTNLKAVETVLGDLNKKTLKKIDIKKLCKNLVKRDKAIFKAYKSFEDIMKETQKTLNSGMKIPKVKYGTKGKGNKKKIKMSKKMLDRFNDAFMESDAKRELIALLYTHTTAVMLGMDIGSKEYLNEINAVMASLEMRKLQKNCSKDDVKKAFAASAKAYAAAKAKDEPTA